MPDYEDCAFDTNLFGFKVGRIDLEEEDLKDDLIVDLRRAEGDGIKLLYLIGPKYGLNRHEELERLEDTFPGTLVDWKTFYSAPLSHWKDEEALRKDSTDSDEIKIIKWEREDCPEALHELSLAAGIYSRFKVDRRIPEKVFEGVYGGWIKNSINKSMADETFVAVHSGSGAQVGLITVKQKGHALVDIGLLAVSAQHRRKGISRKLLAQATLWARQCIGDIDGAKLQVVTQGTNHSACMAYVFCYTIVFPSFCVCDDVSLDLLLLVCIL